MDETACLSQNEFAAVVREFVHRLRNDDRQMVLAHAILLDIALEADNACDQLGLNPAALRSAGEAIRASFRAYQQGNRSEAVALATGVLSQVAGEQTAIDGPGSPVTATLSLLRALDGTYWIRILDEQVFPAATREGAARVVGPLPRNQVFHHLKLLGLRDQQADAFIEQADIDRTAEIRGVRDSHGK